MDMTVGLWRKLSTENLMFLNCSVVENSWESLGLQGDLTSPSSRISVLGVHWKDWCWSLNSSTLATSSEELTRWKRPWCWEGLGAGGEGDDRGWDDWMASPTRCAWVWVNSGSLWWTGRPGVLQFMGLQRVGHNWVNWTELKVVYFGVPYSATLQIPVTGDHIWLKLIVFKQQAHWWIGIIPDTSGQTVHFPTKVSVRFKAIY